MRFIHLYDMEDDDRRHMVGESCECWCEPFIETHIVSDEEVKLIFHGNLHDMGSFSIG